MPFRGQEHKARGLRCLPRGPGLVFRSACYNICPWPRAKESKSPRPPPANLIKKQLSGHLDLGGRDYRENKLPHLLLSGPGASDGAYAPQMGTVEPSSTVYLDITGLTSTVARVPSWGRN